MNRLTLAITAAIVAGLAIAAFTLWPGAAPEGADPDNPEQVALGNRLYAVRCAGCHGAKLEGQPNWRDRLPDGSLRAPPHDETGHTWHHADGLLFHITKQGGQALAPAGFKSNMPGFGGTMKDNEIWAVLAFIKSWWPAKVRERSAAINERARQQGTR